MLPLNQSLMLSLLLQLGFADDPVDTTNNHICSQQTATCKNACLNQFGGVETNTCDVKTLVNSCVCNGGKVLDSTKVDNVATFDTCQSNYITCVKGCGSTDTCVKGCQTQFPCGTTIGSNNTAASTTDNGNSGGSKTTGSNLKSNAEIVQVTILSVVGILFQ